eukprot:TRINITY_DN6540_c0_g1_i4.p1 TRINITY_DN6540_c0_g1~~TRINITY_DN6540_c0_g1_i4.p1  ORF type:complete len:792 (-),score=151.04 TRINITY_DN6540_c0_g1_i4:106-2424(-)
MPKVDRAAEQRKEAAKVNKKMANEKQKAVKEAQAVSEHVEQLPKSGSKSSVGTGAAAQGPRGAFNSARVAQDDSDDEPEEVQQESVVREGPSSSEMPTKSKKSEKLAERNRQANRNGKGGEFTFLEEEERSARQKRIVDRLLRMLIIGFFLGDKDSGYGHSQTGKSGKKKPNSRGSERKTMDFATMREKASEFSGPLMMLFTMILLMVARLSEENYSPDTSGEQVNHYDVLGVPRDAGVLDIRRAYKALALQWHPDKNPDCESCVERFARISKSYETLNNPEHRTAYDNQRTVKNTLNFANTMELTAENFEHTVLRSNEVWIIQICEPKEESCRSFHPIWEEATLQYGSQFRFGRIDVSKQKKALDFFPQTRVVLMPVIWRFMRGREPEQIVAMGTEDHGQSSLNRFLGTTYTEVRRITTAEELAQWSKETSAPVIPVPTGLGGPRILVVSPFAVGATLRGTQRDMYMKVKRVFHQWGDFASFAVTDSTIAKRGLSDYEAPGGTAWTVYVDSGDKKVKVVVAQNIEEMPAVLEEQISNLVVERVPLLTVRNYNQLCGTHGRAGRSYCLLLVNQGDDSLAKNLGELSGSRKAYAQEQVDLAASDGEEGVTESVHIQPVRLTTKASWSPWQAPVVGPAFSALWSEAKYAKAFLLELETRRIAIVKSSTLTDIYSQVAYDDIKFHEVAEGISIVRALPDPEMSLRREIIGTLSTGLGAVFSFLVVAVASAIAPELSGTTSCISAGAFVAVTLVAWPSLCRRLLSFFVSSGTPFPF